MNFGKHSMHNLTYPNKKPALVFLELPSMSSAVRTFGVMYDHTFSKLGNHQTSHQDRHKVGCQPGDVTSIFLTGLCGYVWVNILTLSPLRGDLMGFMIFTSLAKEVMFLVALVSLFVCLSVDNITHKVMNGLGWNFMDGSWVVQGRTD